MSKRKLTYQELEKRLAAAAPIVALRLHQVDAVVGEKRMAILLLKGVQEALLNCEKGFRAIFGLPGVGMIQAESPAFRLSRVNANFCNLLGYSAKELVAKTYIDLTDQLDRVRDMNELAVVLRGKADSWSIEKHFTCKDGRAVRVMVDGTALRNDGGGVVRILAMIRPVVTSKPAFAAARRMVPKTLRNKKR